MEEKMPLKDISETGERPSSLDNQLNMGCEGDRSCVGGLGSVPRILHWGSRLMAKILIKEEKQKSRLERSFFYRHLWNIQWEIPRRQKKMQIRMLC